MQELIMQEVTGFITVFVTAIVIAGIIALLYSSALRLWEKAAEGDHMASRVVSLVCFAACAVIVLYALWLIIPAFH